MVNLYEDQILDYFIYNPMKKFGIRELSRISNKNTKTIMKYLKELIKKKVIKKVKKNHSYPYYESNRLSNAYKLKKSNLLLNKIAEIELIDYLEKELHPKAIVLFGSVQKGTYTKNSDIDIFIQGKEKKINLSRFEKNLKHKINLFFKENLNKLSEGLKHNIINGYTLSGGLQL